MIDELNKLEYEKENSVNIIPIQRYFKEMELSEKQIKEREKFATDLKDMFMIFFLLFRGNKVAGNVQDIDYYNTMLNRQYKELLETYSLMSYLDDDMVNAYIPLMLASVINTTYEKQDEPYILSEERAEFLSTDQANTVLNEADYNRAIKNGATHKRWIKEPDERVRKTHKAVTNKDVPIDYLYTVGTSTMRYAKDTKYSPSLREIINCRCSMEYSINDNKNDVPLENNDIAKIGNNDIIENIKGYVVTQHLLERINQRELLIEDIVDAIVNPLFVDNVKFTNGKPSIKQIGKNVTVYLNPNEKTIPTAHRTSTRTRKKYENEQ